MFHCNGDRFTSVNGVKAKFRHFAGLWNHKITLALIELAGQSGMPGPDSEQPNGWCFNFSLLW
jgi:hypothetical protein